MTPPKTLREFDALFAPLDARWNEVVNRETATREQRIAYYRDLIAAEEAIRDLYRQAMGSDTVPASGLVWSALWEAADTYEVKIARRRARLTELLAEGGDV